MNMEKKQLATLWRQKKFTELLAFAESLLQKNLTVFLPWRYKAIALYALNEKTLAKLAISQAKDLNDPLAETWEYMFEGVKRGDKQWENNYNQINEDLRQSLDPEQKYPQRIGIEVAAKCNAHCKFCPYQKRFTRKGQQMKDTLFYKILSELQDIPQELPLVIEPHLLTEPFLDKRIIEFYKAINNKLPMASLHIFSNGSLCTPKVCEELSDINVNIINISLNDSTKEEYEKRMGLPFEKTITNLDEMHNHFNGISPYIQLSRVGDGSINDERFIDFVHERFPKFTPVVNRCMTWTGDMEDTNVLPKVPMTKCFNFTGMTIICTGQAVLCCIDGEAKYVMGDVNKHHLLEIYNTEKYRKYRTFTGSIPPAPCHLCKVKEDAYE